MVSIFVNEAVLHRAKNAKGEKFCEHALQTLSSMAIAMTICVI
jgi:hypothetical protein